MQPDQLAMRIPTDFVAGSAFVRDLNESYVALGQAPGHEALPAKVACFRSIEAIELLGGFRFPGDIKGLGRLRLHAESEFECLNARLEFRIVIPAVRALAVHLLQ